DHLVGVREYERVIGRARGLALENRARVAEQVAARAMHLRHAAQRVRILDLAAVLVRLGDLGSDQQLAQECGHCNLSGMRTSGDDARIERAYGALERLER